MVPFLAVFALWHPADNSSQPGSLRVPLAPAGLFVLCWAPSRGEKQHFPACFGFLRSAGLFVSPGKQQSPEKGDKGAGAKGTEEEEEEEESIGGRQGPHDIPAGKGSPE